MTRNLGFSFALSMVIYLVLRPIRNTPRNLKTAFPSENASDVSRPHYVGDICKRNNHRSFLSYAREKLGHCRDAIVFQNLRFKMFSVWANPAFSNSSGMKSVFEKLHIRDGLVWTVGQTKEIKLRLQISSP